MIFQTLKIPRNRGNLELCSGVVEIKFSCWREPSKWVELRCEGLEVSPEVWKRKLRETNWQQAEESEWQWVNWLGWDKFFVEDSSLWSFLMFFSEVGACLEEVELLGGLVSSWRWRRLSLFTSCLLFIEELSTLLFVLFLSLSERFSSRLPCRDFDEEGFLRSLLFGESSSGVTRLLLLPVRRSSWLLMSPAEKKRHSKV